MHSGSLLILLHAHLPYVRHPEHEHFTEENWLYEAAVETYLPVLQMLERLLDEGVDFKLTLSLSPTLLEMLADRLLRERLLRYVEGMVGLAEREVRRTRRDAGLNPLSRMYLEGALRARRLLEGRYRAGLAEAFSAVFASGRVEPVTTAATHAYLPVLAPYPEAVAAQLRLGVHTFSRHVGRAPAGLWLPECGYFEGLDRLVAEAGAGYFFLEAHGLLHARPRPPRGLFAALRTPAGPAAFAREPATASRVWSMEEGIPGHPHYRDFHRDLGFELPLRELRTFAHPDGVRAFTGIKYWSIGRSGGRQEAYQPGRAARLARRHASRFLRWAGKMAAGIRERYGFAPVFVAPFDCELFGHWWFEGPVWLEYVLRGEGCGRGVRTVLGSEYLAGERKLPRGRPSPSSWGEGGYGATWAGTATAWAVHPIHRATERMAVLARKKGGGPLVERAGAQALRELLLAQASDWPFLLNKGSHAAYARGRIMGHLERFDELRRMVEGGFVDGRRVQAMEERAPLFPDLTVRDYPISLA